ncbi:hypothetical protein HK099_002946, partial [Clydaea vesicula]
GQNDYFEKNSTLEKLFLKGSLPYEVLLQIFKFLHFKLLSALGAKKKFLKHLSQLVSQEELPKANDYWLDYGNVNLFEFYLEQDFFNVARQFIKLFKCEVEKYYLDNSPSRKNKLKEFEDVIKFEGSIFYKETVFIKKILDYSLKIPETRCNLSNEEKENILLLDIFFNYSENISTIFLSFNGFELESNFFGFIVKLNRMDTIKILLLKSDVIKFELNSRPLGVGLFDDDEENCITVTFDISRFLLENREDCFDAVYMDDVITFGDLKLIRYISNKRVELFNIWSIDLAANRGDLEIVKFLLEKGTRYTTFAINIAARYGHLEVIKYLSENGTEGCTTRALDNAAGNGHLEVVQYLSENRTEGCTTKAIDNAAAYGHMEVVKYLLENRMEGCTLKAIDKAAENGHLEVVQYLSENRTEGCTTKAIDDAAAYGHVEVVKYLSENRMEGCTTEAIDGAAENGHLEVVKYLSENRIEGCTEKAMDTASFDGHIEVVKYLSENRTEGCTTIALDNASCHGHLEVVKYLSENRIEGCTTVAMDYASCHGHIEVVKYLSENRTEGCTEKAMDYASRDGHLEVVKYLSEKRNEGCTTDAMDLASRRGHIEVVKYLSENRTEGCTAKAMDGAARMGHLAVVKYLFENRTEWCIPTAVELAAKNNFFQIVKFLTKRTCRETTNISQNGDYIAHKDKNVVAGLENGQVQIDIKGLSSGQWVVDLVDYSNSIKVSQTVQLIELWSLSCNPSDGVAGTLVYCSYKATSTNIYARISQNKDYITNNNLDQPLNSLNGQFQYLTTWLSSGMWDIDLVNKDTWKVQASFQFQISQNKDYITNNNLDQPLNSLNGQFQYLTTWLSSGMWDIDLVNKDTWKVQASFQFQVISRFSLSCDIEVESGNNINCKYEVPANEKGSYIRVYQNNNIPATADRTKECTLEKGDFTTWTSKWDSGLWTVDLFNRDTGIVHATVTVNVKRWNLQCFNDGRFISCDYETKGLPNSYDVRVYQFGEVDKTADRSVRCVQSAGNVQLNSIGLTNGLWTVDIINIHTFEVMFSTFIQINNINRVDLTYVMHTPVWFDGAVTSAGSDYLRTELRQEANWNALLGYQSLTVLQSINIASQNGVFVGQILAEYNGKHSPVLYVALKPNTANPSTYDLKAFVNEFNQNSEKINTSSFMLKSNYKLGTTYEIKIRIAQGEVNIFYNGELKTKDYNTKFAANIFSNVYFKTGSYGQTKRADDASINNQVSQIRIYKLEVSN